MTRDELKADYPLTILIEHISVLRKEVEVLTKRLEPAGKGHIITAIGVINGRIDELMSELTDNNDNYERPNAVRDAYLHSSKVKDDSHYTPGPGPLDGKKCVYDKGLSDRSQFLRTMKQKHGQSVMTTSEMMQEELEPLPINTFE